MVHKDLDSDCRVNCPDLPDCTTACRTMEEAREIVAESLALHHGGMDCSSMKTPEPNSTDALVTHSEASGAIAQILVEALPEHTRVRVSR